MQKYLTLRQAVGSKGLEWFDVSKDENKKSENYKD